MALLTIEGLKVRYPVQDGEFIAVDDVDLEVGRGEILGLVGESGAGKSTVGSAVIGLIDPPGEVRARRIDLAGMRVDPTSEASMRAIRGKRVSMIFQDPLTSLNPLFTIGQQLVETIRRHKEVQRPEAWAEALELLGAVGVADAETRIHHYPHQFSGGMRQRVVIALALCSDPGLIIADEPTTALDVSIQAQVLALIRRLAKEREVGVILITHDMGVIAEITDRVAVMYRGRIVEIGPTAQILEAPVHDYTRSLISVVPRSDVKLKRLPEIDYIERAPKHRALSDVRSHWLGRSDGGQAPCGGGGAPILSVRNLTMTFETRRSIFPARRRSFTAVSDLSLDIRPGSVVGLVGESGSGKSTVARLIAGLYTPASGSILFKGKDIVGLPRGPERRAIRRQIQMIFQDPYSSLNPRMRVSEIIAEPIRHYGLAAPGEETAGIVQDLLEMVGLGCEAGRKFPHEFSGGQRQRIGIARALATRPQFLICDEPTSALDVSIQAQILNLLKDLQEALNLTMLFISHDLPVIRQMCDEVAVMRNGRLCEFAPTDELFDHPRHDYTKHLLALMPTIRHKELA